MYFFTEHNGYELLQIMKYNPMILESCIVLKFNHQSFIIIYQFNFNLKELFLLADYNDRLLFAMYFNAIL